ncbi:hypothetical protein XH93_21465 [Bradyrhizobium sp. CCBAU 51753]|nr:hypothetical protein XH93_21465 [Bradyrhizobium sp. CCBAU 51753]VIO74253.1 hypothetical protein CI41S_43320 [Bradyrhizobium ivorense]
MRSVLALGLLVMLCVPADAAPRRHPRAREPVVTRPPAEAPQPRPGARFAVPGWSDESTQRWLDKATEGLGGG